MTVILFDESSDNLLPLTYTRPVSDLRVGILTIAEKWKLYLDTEDIGSLSRPYLRSKFPLKLSNDNLFISAHICPDDELVDTLEKLETGYGLFCGERIIAFKTSTNDPDSARLASNNVKRIEYTGSFVGINYPEDIFKNNGTEITKDFKKLTIGRVSAILSSTNTIIGDQIFVEEGATAECATFNTTNGPVYLGKNSQVWEGSHIRGPFALCEDSIVKMGAKIYGMTTIGPHCKAGGEINNSVMWGNSAKGHEGYLGNSVVGEWCNLGADTNTSNMKNNYAEVRLWHYPKGSFRRTGLQFCGLVMGDHSKCGINTMFNTGTVVGVSANIFGSGFPRNFIPDFSWGGNKGFETYSLPKVFETVSKVYERRGLFLDDIERNILTEIFEKTGGLRQGKSPNPPPTPAGGGERDA